MVLFIILYVTVSRVANHDQGYEQVSVGLDTLLGVLSCISFFFRLRVMDEIKDFKTDQVVHPERLVVQGKVSIPFLIGMSLPGFLLEAYWSYSHGLISGLLWAVAVGYTLLMRYEFFIGEYLGKRLFSYAFTHTLIMPLVVAWLWSAQAHIIFGPSLALYLLMAIAFFAALAFEVARKTYSGKEEPIEIMTYSKRFGRKGASMLASLLLLINCLGLFALFELFALAMWPLGLSFLVFFIVFMMYVLANRKGETNLYRKAEKMVSLAMVLNYSFLIWML
ncbi:MAG: hypothetical protein LPK45_01840 [Bacteroidota bacterium]|nr:hypothetical protein [Bacteroidota bacterium]MDX5429775.1 hypothetical protein [Bacteroidota bacterium]MDX5468554.1 hypothetical protein [Bacteroidota bacterium]